MFRSYSSVVLTVTLFASPAFAGSLADETQKDLPPQIAVENREHIRGMQVRLAVIESRLKGLERKPEVVVGDSPATVIVTPIPKPTREEKDLEAVRGQFENFKLTCIYLNMENEVSALASLPVEDIPDPFVCESDLKLLEKTVDKISAREQGATVFVGTCLDFIPILGMGPSLCGVAGMGHWAEGKYNGYKVDLFAKVAPNSFSLGAGATTAIYRRTRAGHWAHGVIVGGEINDLNIVGSYRTDRLMTGTLGYYGRWTFDQGPKGYLDMEFIGGAKTGLHNVSPGASYTMEGRNGWIFLPGLEIRISWRATNRDDDPSEDGLR